MTHAWRLAVPLIALLGLVAAGCEQTPQRRTARTPAADGDARPQVPPAGSNQPKPQEPAREETSGQRPSEPEEPAEEETEEVLPVSALKWDGKTFLGDGASLVIPTE